MSRHIPPTYKARNWPAYNEALKRRGSLTIWFDPEMSWEAAPTGKRGRQQTYGDTAIQTCLTMKVLFGLALRQTTGFVESLLRLVGLDWSVPDVSTLSRRQKVLAVNIPYRGSKGPLHLLIDSTGIEVEGEGEWPARKHGGPKRRVWRKIHLGIDEQTLEVRAVEGTESPIGDAPVLPDLLSQIPAGEEIGSVTADGAYDIVATELELIKTREALQALTSAWGKRVKFRQNSSASRTLGILPFLPVLSVRTLTEMLGVTPKAAGEGIDRLVEAKILKEVTGNARNRIFVAPDVVRIISRPFGAEPVLINFGDEAEPEMPDWRCKWMSDLHLTPLAGAGDGRTT